MKSNTSISLYSFVLRQCGKMFLICIQLRLRLSQAVVLLYSFSSLYLSFEEKKSKANLLSWSDVAIYIDMVASMVTVVEFHRELSNQELACSVIQATWTVEFEDDSWIGNHQQGSSRIMAPLELNKIWASISKFVRDNQCFLYL